MKSPLVVVNSLLAICYASIAFVAFTIVALAVFMCGLLWFAMWQAVTQ